MVKWKGSTFEVHLLQKGGACKTNSEVYKEVRERVGCELIRLIVKGNILPDDGAPLAGPVHLLAVGTALSAAAAVRDAPELQADLRRQRRVRDVVDDLDDDGNCGGDGAEAELSDEISGVRCGFGRVEALGGFGDTSAATAMLRRLATDGGVRSVMRRRRWFVPVLREMYPEGTVGQDPVCVLGLNVNSGQEIHLRLRTDDLEGWRKYLTTIKVLYHELAHNEISSHTPAFYALVSQIDREANAPGVQGHVVGGANAPRRATTKATDRPAAPQRLGGADRGATGAEGRSRLLDAQVPGFGFASKHRAADEAPCDPKACICGACPAPPAAYAGEPPPAVSPDEPPTAVPMEDAMDLDGDSPMIPDEPDVDVDVEPSAPAPDPEGASSAGASDVASLVAMGFSAEQACAALEAAGGDVDRAVERLLQGDDEDAAGPPPVDPASRQARILAASTELKALGASAAAAAQTLRTILANVDKADAKYRRIRLANSRFHETCGRFAAALRLLEATGFERDGPDLVLKRAPDAALIWLGRTALA